MTDQTLSSDLTLTVEKLIPAPPEPVYDVWLDAEMFKRFMPDCQGMQVPRATTDPVIGGTFEIVLHNGKEDVPHTGTCLDLQPHSRIVFTRVSPYSTAENSTVTLNLAPASGGTLLTLTHVRFASEGRRDGHRGSWTTILNAPAAGEF